MMVDGKVTVMLCGSGANQLWEVALIDILYQGFFSAFRGHVIRISGLLPE